MNKELPTFWLRRQSDYDVIPASVEEEIARILPAPGLVCYPDWWIEYGDGGADGYELLIHRCDKGHATGRKSYDYLATVSLFDRHIGKPYYELREDVWGAEGKNCTYHIFGTFKTLRGAIMSLVRHGTFTRNGRKAVSHY